MSDTKPAVLVDGKPVPIEVGQVWKTRCGYPVRILCTDLGRGAASMEPGNSIAGHLLDKGTENHTVCVWQSDGKHMFTSRDLIRLISPAPAPEPGPEPRETTRVWVALWESSVNGALSVSAWDVGPYYPWGNDIARIVLDIPHGVGLGPEGPMHVKVGAPNE